MQPAHYPGYDSHYQLLDNAGEELSYDGAQAKCAALKRTTKLAEFKGKLDLQQVLERE